METILWVSRGSMPSTTLDPELPSRAQSERRSGFERADRRAGVRRHGPGIYMDWVVDKSYIMPYPSGGGEGYLERLLEIKKSYGLDIVIPNLDAELPFYIKYAAQLREHGIASFLPSENSFACAARTS